MEHGRFACALVSLCNREPLSSTQRGNKRDERIWPEEEEDWTRADRARFASQREQLFISFHARARADFMSFCVWNFHYYFSGFVLLLRGSNEKSRGVHTYCTHREQHSDTRAMTDMCSVRSFCSSRRSRQWGHYSHNNNWSSHSNGCVTGQR